MQLPESAQLKYFVDKATGKKSFYPLVYVKNVYVFPGIPKLLERAFSNLEVSTQKSLWFRFQNLHNVFQSKKGPKHVKDERFCFILWCAEI